MRRNSLKEKLQSGQPAIGTWLSLGDQLAARFLARTGFDWLCIDVEHSLVNIETTTHILGAVADAGCVPLARVPANKHDHIKRILDNGGYGVVVPMVNTPQEAADAVAACKYPPHGTRSVGGSVHALNFAATPTDYYAQANDEIAIILQCEHIDAVRNFDAVYGPTKCDAVFVGPNDLAASMRTPDGKPPSPEAFSQALNDILTGCQRLGIPAGIHTFSLAEAKARLAEGWRFIAVASELKFMLEGASQVTTGLGLKASELAKY
ncbi:MAG: HpcH/HpaI aldolase family protein [Fimbriiglobus sp.]